MTAGTKPGMVLSWRGITYEPSVNTSSQVELQLSNLLASQYRLRLRPYTVGIHGVKPPAI